MKCADLMASIFDNVVIHGKKVMSPGELHMVVELSDELKFQ